MTGHSFGITNGTTASMAICLLTLKIGGKHDGGGGSKVCQRRASSGVREMLGDSSVCAVKVFWAMC